MPVGILEHLHQQVPNTSNSFKLPHCHSLSLVGLLAALHCKYHGAVHGTIRLRYRCDHRNHQIDHHKGTIFSRFNKIRQTLTSINISAEQKSVRVKVHLDCCDLAGSHLATSVPLLVSCRSTASQSATRC